MSKPKQLLEHGQVFKVGDNEFQVVHVNALDDGKGGVGDFVYEIYPRQLAEAIAEAQVKAAEEESKRAAEELNKRAADNTVPPLETDPASAA